VSSLTFNFTGTNADKLKNTLCTQDIHTVHKDVSNVEVQARNNTFKHFEVLSKPRHLKD